MEETVLFNKSLTLSNGVEIPQLATGAKVLEGKRFSASASSDELKKWAEQF